MPVNYTLSGQKNVDLDMEMLSKMMRRAMVPTWNCRHVDDVDTLKQFREINEIQENNTRQL